jgi:hypothetical protein
VKTNLSGRLAMNKNKCRQESMDNCCCKNDEICGEIVKLGKENIKPKVLLHSCCGPCSTAVIERLFGDYRITVFYYNPCITENDEYEKRKQEQIRFIYEFNKDLDEDQRVRYIEGAYKPEEYLELVTGLETEPEGGARCTVCFRQRLEETARIAKEYDFDFFASTLTVSPHKNYALIAEIGRDCEKKYGVSFLDMDFKKKAGFQRSIQLSKEHHLYRQNYCGCKFSKR